MRIVYFLLIAASLFLAQCSSPKKSGRRTQVVTIDGIWFAQVEDNDRDTYRSYSRLVFDVDVNTGDVQVDALLGYRAAGTSTFIGYGIIENIPITGATFDDTAWFEIGLPFDELGPGSYDFLLQIFLSENPDDPPVGEVSPAEEPALGNIRFEPAAEDIPFTVTFINSVHTIINLSPPQNPDYPLSPAESITYFLYDNPGTLSYFAETFGGSVSGGQIGLAFTWGTDQFGTPLVFNVSGQNSVTFDLVLSSDYFFLYLRNSGSVTIAPLIVNYGLQEASIDSIIIPNDGLTYTTGYYEAFTNTVVVGVHAGTQVGTFWEQGIDFFLPWVDNQTVTLTNTFKNKISAAPGIGSFSGGDYAPIFIPPRQKQKKADGNSGEIIKVLGISKK